MNESDTWAILASGPSMSQEVADSVRGLNVIAISNTYELAPWADVLVSNDRRWWVNYSNALKFEGEKYCGLCIETPKGVTKFPGAISGSNSGLLALMVAVKKGAKRILLFGYDMGGSHYFGDHAHGLPNPSQKRFDSFKKQFAGYKPAGVEIINCTPGSALKCYPFGDAKELIPQPPEPPPEPPTGPQGERGEKGEPGESIVGPRGPRGEQGEQGPIGPIPDHQWDGTSLRFEEPDGTWGKSVDLRGPVGLPGSGGGGGGGRGMTPDQQLQLNTLLDIFGGWIATAPVAVIDELTIDELNVNAEGSATGFYPTLPPAPAGFVGMAWNWDWGDGSAISTTQNASHTYAESGTYTISFRAKNHIGWSEPVTEEVEVSGEPPVEFTPADLFSSGQVGGWYDSTDISTLFQDSARTIPVTTAGQAIGGVADKSGNGLHLVVDTGSITYEVDGNGVGYVNFNGSSSLRVNVALTGSELATAHVANNLAKPSGAQYWACLGSTSALSIACLYHSDDVGSFAGQYNDGAAGPLDLAISDAGIDWALPNVVSSRCAAGKMVLNGVEDVGTGAAVNLSTVNRFNWGSVRLDSGNFGFATGHGYGVVWRTTEWSDAEDALLQTWLSESVQP